MNSLDALGVLAVILAMPWLLTGFAIWNRWGWCGVRWIWRKRLQIDQYVENDISRG